MNTNLELIEKYIDGDLEGKALTEFEKLLSSDSDIKRDYLLSKEINNSVMEDDVMALRETLNYMYTEETKVKRVPNLFSNRKFYYAAASAALLVAAGGIAQKLSNPELSNDAIFNKYYAPYEVTVTYRSGNTEIDRILLSALEKYDNKDYDNAMLLFEQVLEQKKNDMALNLYSGITFLEEQSYQKAEKSFNTIISNNNNLFIEQAKWYLAMCYVKTKNDKKAKQVLNQIIKDDGYYKDVAEKVLNDLD